MFVITKDVKDRGTAIMGLFDTVEDARAGFKDALQTVTDDGGYTVDTVTTDSFQYSLESIHGRIVIGYEVVEMTQLQFNRYLLNRRPTPGLL